MHASITPAARLTLLLSLWTLATASQAAGFRLPETSVAGIAMANALVADTELRGALSYNPAAMSFHDGGLVAGLMNIHHVTEVTPEGGSTTESEAQQNIVAPNVYYMNRINGELTWGVGLNAPFGLETRWADETFATFVGPVDGLEPEHSKVEMVNLNPNLAWQLSEHTSVAVGLDYFLVRELVFNTQSIDIDGNGQGLGWNLGVQHRHGAWSFGLAYRSSVVTDIDGTVDATALGGTRSSASTELEFPSLLQIGARYEFNPEWALELDIERTGWSSFDVIEIEHSSGITSPILSTNEWRDTTAYRLGVSHQLSPATQLRIGYARENSPETGDYTSARVPASELQTFGIGMAHQLGALTIEASYMLVRFDALDFDSNRSYLAGVGGGNTDPNGTDAYNGKYATEAHLLGIGLIMDF